MTKPGHNHRGTPRQDELLTRGRQAEGVVLAHRTHRFDLQRELYAALHARLPWSREADDGWPDEAERWHRRGRPGTTGWEF